MTLRPIDAAQTLGEDRLRILNALNYLEQQQMIELRVAGVRQGYRMLNVPADPEPVIQRMQEQFALREQRDIQRLQTVCDWAESTECQQQALVRYFGETLAAPCGQCSVCLGEKPQLPARRRRAPDLALIQAVREENHQALASPRQLARFLCGISSPRASRARLARHPAFGSQMDAPFSEVLAACESA